MEFRNLFKNIFGKKANKTKTTLKLINGYNANYYYNYNSSIYENEIARECIDTIASHVAKLAPKHVKNNIHVKDNIDRIISSSPNKYMNKYDFLYKIVSVLYTHNICFIYINIENDKLEGLYPINANSYKVLVDEAGKKYYLEFNYENKIYTVELESLIVLRRFYNDKEVYPENNEVLKDSLETQSTSIQGIKNAIRLSNSLKGIIQMNKILTHQDLKKIKEDFINDYIDLKNIDDVGIAMLDSRAEYKEIKVNPFSLSSEELKQVNNNIYRYFRISEDIINSVYNEESWNSFYRSVIETIAVQLSIEFTNKIFNKLAIYKGHAIKFYSNLLDYTNLETKIKMVKEISALGILTKNEFRELFGYSALENQDEGNKLLQSLNYVDSKYAEEYQLKAIKGKEKSKNIKGDINGEKE